MYRWEKELACSENPVSGVWVDAKLNAGGGVKRSFLHSWMVQSEEQQREQGVTWRGHNDTEGSALRNHTCADLTCEVEGSSEANPVWIVAGNWSDWRCELREYWEGFTQGVTARPGLPVRV